MAENVAETWEELEDSVSVRFVVIFLRQLCVGHKTTVFNKCECTGDQELADTAA